MISGVMSPDEDLQMTALVNFATMLSEEDPPIAAVVQSGVVPRFLQLLSFPDLTHQASLVLELLIDNGALTMFVNLLSSNHYEERLMACDTLGNMLQSPFRDDVINCGAITHLLGQVNDNSTLDILRSVSRTLAFICKGETQLLALPFLECLECLLNSTDDLVLKNTSLALSFLRNASNLIDVIPRLIELLAHPMASVQFGVLRTIRNIFEGDIVQTHVHFILEHQLLPSLLDILKNSENEDVKLETCCLISGIASEKNTWQEMFDAGVVEHIVPMLHSDDTDFNKCAVVTLCGLTRNCSADLIKWIVSQGCIGPLCDLLTCSDPESVFMVLHIIEEVLKVDAVSNTEDYKQKIVDAGGMEKIDNLQSHESDDIRDVAVRLIVSYFE